MPCAIRVRVVCGNATLASLLESLITGCSACELVPAGSSGYDVLLWGLDACVCRPLPPSSPRPAPIVLVSTNGDFEDGELDGAGITAYAGPGSTAADIFRCLRAAAQGETLRLRCRLPVPLANLTPSLRTMARCLLSGKSQRQIRQELGWLSRDGVHSAIKRLYEQLGVHTRDEAIASLCVEYRVPARDA